MPAAAPPLRQRLRDAAMTAMLDAAEAAMIASGYQGATMQRIAEATGCATGTFYLYFGNKEQLLQAIVARHAEDMYDVGRGQLARGDDPLDKLRRSYLAMLRYTQRHQPFFRLFFSALPLRRRVLEQRLSGPTRRQREDFNRLELEVIREAQRAGQVRRDLPPELLQDFMEAVALSLVEQFLFAPPSVPPKRQAPLIWELIAGGLARRGEEP